ncbi:TPA: hypothetical protein ACRTO2_005019 [Escherichia coli]
MLLARTHDREGMIFRRMRGRAVVLIIAELFTGRLRWGQPVTGGMVTDIADGIRLSDWYYKYIREIKHMRSNT